MISKDLIPCSERVYTEPTFPSKDRKKTSDIDTLNSSLAFIDRLYLHNQERNPIELITCSSDEEFIISGNTNVDYIDNLIKEYSKRKTAAKKIEENIADIKKLPSRCSDAESINDINSSQARKPTQETEMSYGPSVIGDSIKKPPMMRVMAPDLGKFSYKLYLYFHLQLIHFTMSVAHS